MGFQLLSLVQVNLQVNLQVNNPSFVIYFLCKQSSDWSIGSANLNRPDAMLLEPVPTDSKNKLEPKSILEVGHLIDQPALLLQLASHRDTLLEGAMIITG